MQKMKKKNPMTQEHDSLASSTESGYTIRKKPTE